MFNVVLDLQLHAEPESYFFYIKWYSYFAILLLSTDLTSVSPIQQKLWKKAISLVLSVIRVGNQMALW